MNTENCTLTPAAQAVIYVSPSAIVPNPAQPRRDFSAESLASLTDSIRRVGVLCPLLVRRVDGGLELIAGERRLRAAVAANLEHVPCILYEAGREESACLAIIENLQREGLNMFEQAQAIHTLSSACGMTQESIADALSCSQSYVANKLRLLRLDEPLRRMILDFGLTERHARALLRLEASSRADAVLEIKRRHMNVAATEEYIEEIVCRRERERASRRVGEVGRELRHRLLSRDMRLFYNSIDRALESVKSCGIEVRSTRHESDGGTVIEIFVPKTSGEKMRRGVSQSVKN